MSSFALKSIGSTFSNSTFHRFFGNPVYLHSASSPRHPTCLFWFISTVCFTDLGKLNLLFCGSILSSSQFLLLPQRNNAAILAIIVVKIGSNIIISMPWSKSVKQTVWLRASSNHLILICFQFEPMFYIRWIGPARLESC